ncbi:MAG: amidohydrolase family protein [Verrucomicrobia bacterium]|nr:amidohydrolase family protein [Verrucomicrobiota bacterium]
MQLIDTHVHLLHPERFAYEWCAGVPALQGPFPLAAYRAAASRAPHAAHVQAAVFMEADVPAAQQENEAAYFSALVETETGPLPLIAVIAGARPESPDFPAQLARLAANPRIRGLRRVLHTMPDDFSLAPLLAENLRRLPAHGLTFDLCLRPRQLPNVITLVRRCPETQFILDHCGVPAIARGELDPWRGYIRQLAELPNVVCKISGLPGCADPARPLVPQLRPFVEHCCASFGVSRLLWGSDWPVSPDLPAWLEATAELFGSFSTAEKLQLGVTNAQRIYRLTS